MGLFLWEDEKRTPWLPFPAIPHLPSHFLSVILLPVFLPCLALVFWLAHHFFLPSPTSPFFPSLPFPLLFCPCLYLWGLRHAGSDPHYVGFCLEEGGLGLEEGNGTGTYGRFYGLGRDIDKTWFGHLLHTTPAHLAFFKHLVGCVPIVRQCACFVRQ